MSSFWDWIQCDVKKKNESEEISDSSDQYDEHECLGDIAADTMGDGIWLNP